MVKRLLDVVLSSIALVIALPLLALAGAGIRAASPGPVLYRSRRVGRERRPFLMYKLRTMHVASRAGGEAGSAITAPGDARVFRFGRWLRRAKIDELPQLFNVLRGDMSIIGPRPEDPRLVAAHYAPAHLETLVVRPGLASPGSLYSCTHGNALLSAERPEGSYAERLLPVKLALDLVYVRRASLPYDLALMARTAWVIAATLAGRWAFPEPPEMPEARRLLVACPARRQEVA